MIMQHSLLLQRSNSASFQYVSQKSSEVMLDAYVMFLQCRIQEQVGGGAVLTHGVAF